MLNFVGSIHWWSDGHDIVTNGTWNCPTMKHQLRSAFPDFLQKVFSNPVFTIHQNTCLLLIDNILLKHRRRRYMILGSQWIYRVTCRRPQGRLPNFIFQSPPLGSSHLTAGRPTRQMPKGSWFPGGIGLHGCPGIPFAMLISKVGR